MSTIEGRAINRKTVTPVSYGRNLAERLCADSQCGRALMASSSRMEGAQVLAQLVIRRASE